MPDLVEQILKARGYKTKRAREEFLSPDYGRLHDPWLLPDMEAAVARVIRAIDSGERVVIYGDYDIDGLSATALLMDGLGSMGAKVTAYIPDRFEEGYGINARALQRLQKEGADLIITVDCGSVSFGPLKEAATAGLDVIVTDHHEPGRELPEAVAVINPKRHDSDYPFTELAGVGVAFKLIQGLQTAGARTGSSSIRAVSSGLPPGQEKWLLDLVALGTVCDVVPLTDENRILVTYGLQTCRRGRRAGLRALADVAGVDITCVEPHNFGFGLGPRLNAAGRIEHARSALELFQSTHARQARELAVRLDTLNTERQEQQQRILEAAVMEAEARPHDPVLVLSHPDWSHGIVGIVAAKIMERYHKPTIILQEMEDGTAKGSARSMGAFNMVEALRAAEPVLEKYGGHQVAAGCSLRTDNIPQLRKYLTAYYREQGLGDLYSHPEPDMELADMSQLTRDVHEQLERLAPFGMGNPRPVFYLPEVNVVESRGVGSDGQHLKLQLSDGGHSMDAIGFQLGHRSLPPGKPAAVWFELDINDYNGRSYLQLKLRAIE